jgi:hypothetical protein
LVVKSAFIAPHPALSCSDIRAHAVGRLESFDRDRTPASFQLQCGNQKHLSEAFATKPASWTRLTEDKFREEMEVYISPHLSIYRKTYSSQSVWIVLSLNEQSQRFATHTSLRGPHLRRREIRTKKDLQVFIFCPQGLLTGVEAEYPLLLPLMEWNCVEITEEQLHAIMISFLTKCLLVPARLFISRPFPPLL